MAVTDATGIQQEEEQDDKTEQWDVLSPGSMELDPEAEYEQVQSQIAMEEAEMRRAQERIPAVVAKTAHTPALAPDADGNDEDHSRSKGKEAEASNEDPSTTVVVPESAAKQVAEPTAEAAEQLPPKSAFQAIMDMLKGGLSVLRGSNLQRNEVYEIEDVCMDIKRELYAAEKRGRDGQGSA